MAKMKLDLSPAEWDIMEAIWSAGEPVTVRRVLDIAYADGRKAYTTVQTLMNILVEKSILTRVKNGGVNQYAVAVSREKIRKRALSTVARHMFSGSFGAMASYLVNNTTLTPDEIAELKTLLREKEETR